MEISNSDLQQITDIIEEIDICMLTTIGENGRPYTRPMSNNKEVEFDGDLWFFTNAKTHKVLEIGNDNSVSVAFSSLADSNYLVINGTGRLIRDKNKIEQLWKPILLLQLTTKIASS